MEARELIKISVLKNCADDPKELASLLAERTRSQVVQVIGKKIVLYKEGKDKNKKNTASIVKLKKAEQSKQERSNHENRYYGWYV